MVNEQQNGIGLSRSGSVAQVDGLGADPEAALGPGPRSPLPTSEGKRRDEGR